MVGEILFPCVAPGSPEGRVWKNVSFLEWDTVACKANLWLGLMWADSKCFWNLLGSAHCPVRSPKLWLTGTSWTSGQALHFALRVGLSLL